ncbi:MAG: hypothetical protein Kow00108_22890 [Calditrichia bacterium]
MSIEIQHIHAAGDFYTKHSIFRDAVKKYYSRPSREKRKLLIPLLYDWHFGIRYEAAFCVDYFGVTLKNEERFQWLYSMMQFRILKEWCEKEPIYRFILMNGFLDRSERVRAKLLRHFHKDDCLTPEEEILYFYGRRDYRKLWEYAEKPEHRNFIKELLLKGVDPKYNYPYHRRQCALLLENVKLLPNAETFAMQVMKAAERDKQRKIKLDGAQAPVQIMDKLLLDLNQNGLFIDGTFVFPRVEVGSVTNRITYKNPGVQTWPKEERHLRIKAPPGMSLIKFDFKEIEPRLFYHYLLHHLLISLEDVPAGDIYSHFHKKGRETAKRWLNAFINGAGAGGRAYPPHIKKLINARKKLQDILLEEIYLSGGITTLGGNFIPLDIRTTNVRGKAVNRLVQGSAADLFHRALTEIDKWFIRENIDARIYLLIYDEFWVVCHPSAASLLEAGIPEICNSLWKKMGLMIPIIVRRILE